MFYKPFRDISLSTLGMGNMRLPALKPGDPQSPIDWQAAHKILDCAMKAGINYYDTAYVYNGGESERCLGAGLKKYDRGSFYLADKFHYAANHDYKAVFETQLERLQTDHIDFYLLHCLLDNNADDYLHCGCIDYFLEQKARGRIRYLGFSSHAGTQTLRRFADACSWDFAQIQLNYFDWRYGSAAKEYQILSERNIPVMVMEPVRGGRLAALTSDAESLLREARPDRSIASWALNFVRTLPGVQVILSGMSNLEQIQDNIETFSRAEQLSKSEEDILMRACELYHDQLVIPCTGCRYCCDDCPAAINIPEFLKVYNAWKTGSGMIERKLAAVQSQGRPADCIGCGSCAGLCPQGIGVPSIMVELNEKFS